MDRATAAQKGFSLNTSIYNMIKSRVILLFYLIYNDTFCDGDILKVVHYELLSLFYVSTFSDFSSAKSIINIQVIPVGVTCTHMYMTLAASTL